MKTKEVVRDMTIEEMEEALKAKKQEQKEKTAREREQYVKERDGMIYLVCMEAKRINTMMAAFHKSVHEAMQTQKTKLDEYGAIRKNSKGGFQVISEDGRFKIRYAFQAISDYDERANKAEDLLKDFLADMVKKKDKGPYKIIQTLLERNKAGQLEYGRISALYKYEGDYDDARWVEAIKLFKESFIMKDSKMMPLLYEKNEKGVYELINLNFSSI